MTRAFYTQNYPGYVAIRVGVVPNAYATKAAAAELSCALTLDKLALLVADARSLIADLCESQLPASSLEGFCAQLLEKSPLAAEKLVSGYLQSFKTTET